MLIGREWYEVLDLPCLLNHPHSQGYFYGLPIGLPVIEVVLKPMHSVQPLGSGGKKSVTIMRELYMPICYLTSNLLEVCSPCI